MCTLADESKRTKQKLTHKDILWVFCYNQINMTFLIELNKNKLITEAYNKSLNELEKFYGFKWTMNKPKILILKDRKTVNELFERQTPDWAVGWVHKGDVFILDYLEILKTNKKYNKNKYKTLIKHELSHCFYKVISKDEAGPKWLWEGFALYTANQYKKIENIDRLSTFLNFYDKHKTETESVYDESGTVIALLIEKFGKKKLFKLAKDLKTQNTRKKFDCKFKEIYGFRPNYNDFNKLLKK